VLIAAAKNEVLLDSTQKHRLDAEEAEEEEENADD
jgi:hypothetical protein